MTILPKKKASKEKNDLEKKTEHSQLPHNSTSNETRVTRRTSPQRWVPPNARDDRLSQHDPGGRYDECRTLEGTSGHNKRRHRSSPHRNVRKHRHEHPSSSGIQSATANSNITHTRTHGPSTSQTCDVEPDMEDDTQSGYNSGDEYVPPQHPENIEELERWFEKALKEKGFIIKKMNSDGACMFRAVADQVYGDQEMHSTVRQNCVDYMAKNQDFFKQYVTEDFNMYLNRKRMEDCHGNHIEMQALCELFNRGIEVYQYSLEPINTFHGAYKTDDEPIRLSYHQNAHYNSIVHPYKATIGVGLGLPGYQPGLADKNLMSDAMKQSENFHLEKTMLEDKLKETDWEVTQETIEEQVARESYLQWLRDNEKRAKRQASPRSASATCSTASDSQTWWDVVGSSEPRTNRSPRNRSANNSTQNSPSRIEQSSPEAVAKPLSPKQIIEGTQSILPGGPLTNKPGTSGESERCQSPLGAVGGASVNFSETNSIMNDLPPHVVGLSAWEEDDILAQVIAQSQQEYLDSLKKSTSSSKEHGESSNELKLSPPDDNR